MEKKSIKWAYEYAFEMSKEEPEKIYYIVDKERCACRFTANPRMLAIYVGRGYVVIGKVQNGEKIE